MPRPSWQEPAPLARPQRRLERPGGERGSFRPAVGDRVEANCGEWKIGTIVKLFYTQSSFPEGMCAPYQIRLDNPNKLIFAPRDCESVVRRAREEVGMDVW